MTRKMESFYRYQLKIIHSFQRILPPQESIYYFYHRNILTFFNRWLGRDGSIEADIIRRQLAIKDRTSYSWTVMIRELLEKYSLPSACDPVKTPYPNKKWKNEVESKIYQYLDQILKSQAQQHSTLRFLSLKSCKIGRVHPVWQYCDNPHEVRLATIKSRLLIQRYSLMGSNYAGSRQLDLYPLCEEEKETIQHFLFKC